MVGSWSAGTLSNVNFYNPDTGVWGSPSGVGVYYKFTSDGQYEKGVLVQSNLYGCTTTIHSFSQGTVIVEGNKILFYPTYARIKSEDNCSQANNYDKEDELLQETLLWESITDESGKPALRLSYENGTPAVFYRI